MLSPLMVSLAPAQCAFRPSAFVCHPTAVNPLFRLCTLAPMEPQTILKLAINTPFPGTLPPNEGGVLELFRGHNMLLLNMRGLQQWEAKVVRKGPVKVGILVEDTAILLLWRFHDLKGRPIFSFDTPFDARLIDWETLDLPSKFTDKSRLAVTIVLVDRDSKLIKALREISLPLAISDALLGAAMDQLAAPELLPRADARVRMWQQMPIDALATRTSLARAGQ